MRRWALWIIMLVWHVLGYAQQPEVLTLETCIRLAIENSYQLLSDDYRINVAENKASISETAALPRVEGALSMENRFLQPYYFKQMWASVHADWSPGDLIMKTGRSARQDIETKKQEKEQHRLDVIGRSTSLYMSILQIDKETEILGKKMGYLEHHYQVSRGMWVAGIKSELDMLQTESEISRLKEDSVRLAMTGRTLAVELLQLLGKENEQELHLATLNLDSLSAEPVPEISLTDLAKNPRLAAYHSKMNAEQFRLDEVTAEQIPHIAMESGLVNDDDPTGDGNYVQISAGIVVPIYRGKTYSYRKQAIRAGIKSLDAESDQMERELMIHLLQVHDNMVSSKHLLKQQRQRLEMNTRAVDFAEANYKAGIASNLDYLSLQQQCTATALEIEQTKLEYLINLIEFYITNNTAERIAALGIHADAH